MSRKIHSPADESWVITGAPGAVDAASSAAGYESHYAIKSGRETVAMLPAGTGVPDVDRRIAAAAPPLLRAASRAYIYALDHAGEIDELAAVALLHGIARAGFAHAVHVYAVARRGARRGTQSKQRTGTGLTGGYYLSSRASSDLLSTAPTLQPYYRGRLPSESLHTRPRRDLATLTVRLSGHPDHLLLAIADYADTTHGRHIDIARGAAASTQPDELPSVVRIRTQMISAAHDLYVGLALLGESLGATGDTESVVREVAHGIGGIKDPGQAIDLRGPAGLDQRRNVGYVDFF